MKPGMLFLLCLFSFQLSGQRICKESQKVLPLDNGTDVILYSVETDSDTLHTYYYVPTCLRLSANKGVPEFSFQLYRENEDAPPSGAIMHLLLTWGLTSEEEKELQQKLNTGFSMHHLLAGSVQLESDTETLVITSDKPVARALRRSLVSSGHPPTFPSGKMAMSFRFSREDALLMSRAFQDDSMLSGIFFELSYRYVVYDCEGAVRRSYKESTLVKTGVKELFHTAQNTPNE